MSTAWKEIFASGQWKILVEETDGKPTGQYRVVNPDPKDASVERFYAAVSGKFGQPILVQEPTYRVPLPPLATYLSGGKPYQPTKDDWLVGFVILHSDNQTVTRMSFTNAITKGVKYTVNDDGTITLDGVNYHIGAILSPDKNRMQGYVAYCNEGLEPLAIDVLELETLIFRMLTP